MAKWREIRRERDVPIPGSGFPYHARCHSCGREVMLHYNGGELDVAECCGRRYELDAPQIDFVVSVSDEEQS
jgi:hypothetical protein